MVTDDEILNARLKQAVVFDDLNAAKHWIAMGADINALNISGDSLLINLAENNYLDALGLAIRLGASLDIQNARGFTAVCLASAGGYRKAVGVLLDAGADPWIACKRGYTGMSYAFMRNNEEVFLAFLERGVRFTNLAIEEHGLRYVAEQKNWGAVMSFLENQCAAKSVPSPARANDGFSL